MDKYFIDLYFIDHKITVECDEDHHNIIQDTERQEFIEKQLNCRFYRFKPQKDNFIMASVIRDLLQMLF